MKESTSMIHEAQAKLKVTRSGGNDTPLWTFWLELLSSLSTSTENPASCRLNPCPTILGRCQSRLCQRLFQRRRQLLPSQKTGLADIFFQVGLVHIQLLGHPSQPRQSLTPYTWPCKLLGDDISSQPTAVHPFPGPQPPRCQKTGSTSTLKLFPIIY